MQKKNISSGLGRGDIVVRQPQLSQLLRRAAEYLKDKKTNERKRVQPPTAAPVSANAPTGSTGSFGDTHYDGVDVERRVYYGPTTAEAIQLEDCWDEENDAPWPV